jgi:hypothetical protein
MKRPFSSSLLLIFLVGGSAFGDMGPDKGDEHAVDVPGVETSVPSDAFELEDINPALNPFQKLTQRWPEDLVVAPVPAYSAQLGWSLTLGGGYFFDVGEKQEGVSPSVFGGFAMAAENGSHAYGIGTHLHLFGDKLRVKAAAAYIDVRYRFYGIGNTIDFLDIGALHEGPAYFLSAKWNVWKKLYVGLGYLRGNVDTRLRVDVTDPDFFFDPVFNLDVGAITIPIQIDSRDHEQFPRDGWLVTGQTALYRESVGSDFDAQTYKLTINHYFPMRDADVLATRLVMKSADEEVPFFLLSTFGGTTDLRGYPSGRYRDENMYALQTEYRWQFNDRWVFTGFAGVGEVAESFSRMGRNFLPAAGIGARLVLSKKHKVGLSVDVATGKDGTEFYFGVGEAF